MSENITHAPKSIYELVRKLVEAYHPDLEGARIAVLMRFGDWAKICEAYRVSGASGFLAQKDFLIVVNGEIFEKITEKRQIPYLDNALTKCTSKEGADGNKKWKLRKADFEGFFEVAKRWGFSWDETLKNLEETMDQTKLPFDVDPYEALELSGDDSEEPEEDEDPNPELGELPPDPKAVSIFGKPAGAIPDKEDAEKEAAATSES